MGGYDGREALQTRGGGAGGQIEGAGGRWGGGRLFKAGFDVVVEKRHENFVDEFRCVS